MLPGIIMYFKKITDFPNLCLRVSGQCGKQYRQVFVYTPLENRETSCALKKARAAGS